MPFEVFLSGVLSGLGLIVAIGAQNLFLLRQGMGGRHVVPAVATCMVSDYALIAIGTAGLSGIVQAWPSAVPLMLRAGQAFLLVYGAKAAWRALHPAASLPTLPAAGQHGPSRSAVMLQAAAFSWLNPHAWLDASVLLGTLAQAHGPTLRWTFALGAMAASTVWFTSLGWASRRLAPWMTGSPQRWRGLDALVAVTMWTLALQLGRGIPAH